MKKLYSINAIIQITISILCIIISIMLIINPDGSTIGVSNQISSLFPFGNLLLPAIFFLLFNGIVHIIIGVLSVKKIKSSLGFSIIFGIICCLWIVLYYFISELNIISIVLFSLGFIELSIATIALLTKKI